MRTTIAKVLINCDEGNAHNEVDRHTFLVRIREVAPGLCKWLEFIYPTDVATHVFHRGRVIPSAAGPRVFPYTQDVWFLSRGGQGCCLDKIARPCKNCRGRGVVKLDKSGAGFPCCVLRATLSGHAKTSRWIPVSGRSTQLSSRRGVSDV